jgi:nucleotide-binding universal stress UspA family protein
MFEKILHANDGSEPAFKALGLALALAKQNGSELHLVSVMEIDYMPEFVEDIRQPAERRDASAAFAARARLGGTKRGESPHPCPHRASGPRHR